MIKLPKEVLDCFSRLMGKNFSVHVVGGCVRDSLLGGSPADWDMTTNASLDDMVQIFPDLEVISQEFQVGRMSWDGLDVDLARYRVEGEYVDYKKPGKVSFVSNILEDMGRRDFSINAIAYNPETGFVDPFGGIEDIKNRIVRVIGDPEARFTEDPIRILRAIRIGAQKNFKIEEATFEAICLTASLLGNITRDRIRDEFSKIMTASHCSLGLKNLKNAALLDFVLGIDPDELDADEVAALDYTCEIIDNVEPDLRARLALLLGCLKDYKAEVALDFLGYGRDVKEGILDVIQFLNQLDANPDPNPDKLAFKSLILSLGPARTNQLNQSLKAYKYYTLDKILDEIKRNEEAVFIKDLAITGRDLIEEGIVKEGKEVGQLLNKLILYVHKAPEANEREILMKAAGELALKSDSEINIEI